MSDDPFNFLQYYHGTLHDKAWNRLRGPIVDDKGLRLGLPRIRLWESGAGFPGCDPCTITVFHLFDAARTCILRRAVWKRSVDHEKYMTLAFRDALADPKVSVEDLLRLEVAAIKAANEEIAPTVTTQEMTLDREEFERKLTSGRLLQIPVVVPWIADWQSLTSDAPREGFDLFDQPEPQACLSLAWSADVPPEWRPIVEWFNEILRWLSSYLEG